MPGVINTGSFPKLLWPGINETWGLAYAEKPMELTQIFDTFSSKQNFEEDVGMSGLGLVPVKPEGTPTAYGSMKQGFTSRYTHITYALGFIITWEEIQDCLYPKAAAQRPVNLKFVHRQTQENVAANVLNRAFNGAFVGGDSVSLINASHPIAGGTFSNTLAVAADISEDSLEQMLIDISKLVDDRGNLIEVRAEKLIVPSELVFETERILGNPMRPATADRDINAMYQMSKFPQGFVVNHYLTDADAFFIKTDIPYGMRHFERYPLTLEMDNDFDTSNAKYKATCRHSYGWTDPRGLFGSPGA